MCEPISLGQSFFTSFPISHGTSREVCCHSRQAGNILPQTGLTRPSGPRQADLMCFSVSVSKMNPQPVSRRCWLQNELLELHPIAKVCLNSWFPDHQLKIWDLPSLILLFPSFYFFTHQYQLIMNTLIRLNPKLAVYAGIFWELRAVPGTDRIYTFPYCMLSI